VKRTHPAQVNENEYSIESIQIAADIRARREKSAFVQKIICNSAKNYADGIDNRNYKTEFAYKFFTVEFVVLNPVS
jgi:hypothetical protein